MSWSDSFIYDGGLWSGGYFFNRCWRRRCWTRSASCGSLGRQGSSSRPRQPKASIWLFSGHSIRNRGDGSLRRGLPISRPGNGFGLLTFLDQRGHHAPVLEAASVMLAGLGPFVAEAHQRATDRVEAIAEESRQPRDGQDQLNH